MNERIRELYRQSHTDGFFGMAFDPQKFAELIIKECANVAYDTDHDHGDAILEHFELPYIEG